MKALTEKQRRMQEAEQAMRASVEQSKEEVAALTVRKEKAR
jgi:hypothetical protein